MSETPATTIVFGAYELIVVTQELWRDGRRVRLAPQAMRILIELTSAPGTIVSREHLRSVLWPDGIHVDFELSLNTAVRKLRAALNDDADRPRYVQTVPGHGYRFIASVRHVRAAAADDPPAAAAAADARNDRGDRDDRGVGQAQVAGNAGRIDRLAAPRRARPGGMRRRVAFAAAAACVLASIPVMMTVLQHERSERLTLVVRAVPPAGITASDASHASDASDAGRDRGLLDSTVASLQVLAGRMNPRTLSSAAVRSRGAADVTSSPCRRSRSGARARLA